MKRFFTTIRPERFFLAIALFFGLITTFITPPLQSPDAHAHFLVYDAVTSKRGLDQASPGSGCYAPSEMSIKFAQKHAYLTYRADRKYSWSRYKNAWRIKDQPDGTTTKKLYLYYVMERLPLGSPQIVGMWIARQFTDRILIRMLAGRIANLLVYTLLIFVAIRIIPFYKWGLVLISTMPMTLFLAATLSYDALSIAVAFLIIAQMTNISVSTEQVSLKTTLLFLMTLATMTILKFPYVFVVIPSLFLPSRLFNSWKTKTYFCAAIVILLFCSGISPYRTTIHLDTPSSGTASSGTVSSGTASSGTVSSGTAFYFYEHHTEVPWHMLRKSYGITSQPEQLKKLFTQPTDFLGRFCNTVLSQEHILMYVGSFGGCLGCTDTLLPPIALIFFYLILIIQPLLEDAPLERFPPRMRYIYPATASLLFTGIHLIMYMTGAIVYSAIPGLQGKYFIPFAPLLFLSLSSNWLSKKLSLKPIFAKLLVCGTVVFIQAMSVITLFQRYYGDYWWERKL